MKTLTIHIWEKLKTSFWFIPAVIVLASIILSIVLIDLDSNYHVAFEGFFSHFITEDVESARQILSTIAGAMLNVTGIVFSITLVALTLASSEFGSRLLRNFMNDRLNQVVLGTYIATFIFCILILRVVKGVEDNEFIPNISIFVAIIISIANIFLLIAYIHHIAVSIQADYIITDVGKNLRSSLKILYPNQIGTHNFEQSEVFLKEHTDKIPIKTLISNPKSGYLQLINGENLLQIAKDNDLVFEFDHRPGDLIVKNMTLAKISSHAPLNEKTIKKITAAFILGENRTPTHDAEFSVHQLVEIISRALSSGINDPFTAITALDKLTANLSELAANIFPSGYRFDDNGHLRMILNPLTFEGLVNAAFNQVRQYSANNPAVLIRLMEGLFTIKQFTRDQTRLKILRRHADMCMRAGENGFSEPEDIKDLRGRYDQFLEDWV
ncbi:DUF2254 domain-containing protein [Anditalea andensis]|uniref:DUF2254 domain-containing protein n=1 Tax=Anditalea andensis TaxID=1048983 RepID=A0A074KT13_9BACT|nr:DUF2254 domain-containing protein [Anditalea andensis]KEO72054.1 hypothetical protein EL17_19260 [Anditalea andensis]